MPRGRSHDDGGKFARSQEPVAQHVMAEGHEFVWPPQHVAYMAHPDARRDALTSMEPFAIFVRDQSLRQLQRRQNGGAVCRVGDPGMVQPRDEVSDSLAALCIRRQCEAAPAIYSVSRDVIAVPDTVS